MARKRIFGRITSGFSLANFRITKMMFWIPFSSKKPILRQDLATRRGVAPAISTKLEARQVIRIAAKSFFTPTKREKLKIAKQTKLSVRG